MKLTAIPKKPNDRMYREAVPKATVKDLHRLLILNRKCRNCVLYINDTRKRQKVKLNGVISSSSYAARQDLFGRSRYSGLPAAGSVFPLLPSANIPHALISIMTATASHAAR